MPFVLLTDEEKSARSILGLSADSDRATILKACCERLGLSTTSELPEIKKTYRKLALMWHPDKRAPEEQAEAVAKFKVIQSAYDALVAAEASKVLEPHPTVQERGQDFPERNQALSEVVSIIYGWAETDVLLAKNIGHPDKERYKQIIVYLFVDYLQKHPEQLLCYLKKDQSSYVFSFLNEREAFIIVNLVMEQSNKDELLQIIIEKYFWMVRLSLRTTEYSPSNMREFVTFLQQSRMLFISIIRDPTLLLFLRLGGNTYRQLYYDIHEVNESEVPFEHLSDDIAFLDTIIPDQVLQTIEAERQQRITEGLVRVGCFPASARSSVTAMETGSSPIAASVTALVSPSAALREGLGRPASAESSLPDSAPTVLQAGCSARQPALTSSSSPSLACSDDANNFDVCFLLKQHPSLLPIILWDDELFFKFHESASYSSSQSTAWPAYLLRSEVFALQFVEQLIKQPQLSVWVDNFYILPCLARKFVSVLSRIIEDMPKVVNTWSGAELDGVIHPEGYNRLLLVKWIEEKRTSVSLRRPLIEGHPIWMQKYDAYQALLDLFLKVHSDQRLQKWEHRNTKAYNQVLDNYATELAMFVQQAQLDLREVEHLCSRSTVHFFGAIFARSTLLDQFWAYSFWRICCSMLGDRWVTLFDYPALVQKLQQAIIDGQLFSTDRGALVEQFLSDPQVLKRILVDPQFKVFAGLLNVNEVVVCLAEAHQCLSAINDAHPEIFLSLSQQQYFPTEQNALEPIPEPSAGSNALVQYAHNASQRKSCDDSIWAIEIYVRLIRECVEVEQREQYLQSLLEIVQDTSGFSIPPEYLAQLRQRLIDIIGNRKDIKDALPKAPWSVPAPLRFAGGIALMAAAIVLALIMIVVVAIELIALCINDDYPAPVLKSIRTIGTAGFNLCSKPTVDPS